MVSLIYGHKGSGKTNSLIEKANQEVKVAKGIVVYIDSTANHLREVDYNARFINISEFEVYGTESFCAFIKGLVAGNYDIETIFIDHIERITQQDIASLDAVFKQLTSLAVLLKIKFVLTVNATDEPIPEFLKQYLQA